MVNTKTKLTDDLFRLLQVREKNKDMDKDWLLFLTSTPKFNKLTPGEIYHAFKMTLARELRDSKNEEINLLPELSNSATGKVLTAYLEWKRLNDEYQLAKSRLRIVSNETTEESKQKAQQDFIQMVFDEIQSKGFSSDGWLLMDKLENKLLVPAAVKKRLYRLKMRQYLEELKQDVMIQGRRPHHVQLLEDIQKKAAEGKLSGVVQNRCRSVVVCNYLKRFKTFDEFKKEVDGLES